MMRFFCFSTPNSFLALSHCVVSLLLCVAPWVSDAADNFQSPGACKSQEGYLLVHDSISASTVRGKQDVLHRDTKKVLGTGKYTICFVRFQNRKSWGQWLLPWFSKEYEPNYTLYLRVVPSLYPTNLSWTQKMVWTMKHVWRQLQPSGSFPFEWHKIGVGCSVNPIVYTHNHKKGASESEILKFDVDGKYYELDLKKPEKIKERDAGSKLFKLKKIESQDSIIEDNMIKGPYHVWDSKKRYFRLTLCQFWIAPWIIFMFFVAFFLSVKIGPPFRIGLYFAIYVVSLIGWGYFCRGSILNSLKLTNFPSLSLFLPLRYDECSFLKKNKLFIVGVAFCLVHLYLCWLRLRMLLEERRNSLEERYDFSHTIKVRNIMEEPNLDEALEKYIKENYRAGIDN